MENTVKILCENDNRYYEVPFGATLLDISRTICPEVTDEDTGLRMPVLAVHVDHQLKDLTSKISEAHLVKYLGMSHPDGYRTYSRSLCFVLQVAIRKLYPQKKLIIDYSLPSGLYCEIQEVQKLDDGRPQVYFATDAELEKIAATMQEIIDADLPFSRSHLQCDEACSIFEANNQPDKAALTRSRGRYLCSVYYLDGVADTMHGPLLPSTSYIKTFGILGFSNGFCLQLPSEAYGGKCAPMKRQAKIAATLKEHSDWCSILGVKGVGSINQAIADGRARDLINISEALHERKYADIADQIYQRRGSVKIVFIAGPSSSGKTSTSLRLALQCKVLGLNPKVIELDNYFVDREFTPKDEKGNYDFEALGAMNLKLLNEQLNALLGGEKVDIPRYNFKEGKGVQDGTHWMQLEEKDILIMEGIHALNPAMVSGVDSSRIFRVYASALTSLNLDENDNISTSDNRLLRRMVRDNRVRGIIPEETIMRWHSVRDGEERNIFPFQENADAQFNSALIYELPMLKYYVEPLLRRIPANSPAYSEAVRLIKFLGYITALTPDEIAYVPPTSIMREFIGGQSL